MTGETRVRAAFAGQADFCAASGAPRTAAVCRALASGLDRGSATGRRVLDWPNDPVADALPLRLVAGLHALVRAGADAEVGRLFADGSGDVGAILARHDAALLSWLAGPPQTNEPMRAAALMAGLLHAAWAVGPAMTLLEIGASAGVNLLIDRYAFDLGGVGSGRRRRR